MFIPSGFTQRPDLTVMGAFSGLEMACWDILGKDRDCPVWALLGGRDERLGAGLFLSLPDGGITKRCPLSGAMRIWRPRRPWIWWIAWLYRRQSSTRPGLTPCAGGHQPSGYDIETSARFCARIREAVGPAR